MSALRKAQSDILFEGVGGEAMAGEGLKSLFPLSEIAVMGFLPVIAKLPTLLKRIRQTVEAVLAARPDRLVIIDSPDFTHRVARQVRRQRPDLLILDYVSPTVWAWRPGRARKMRAYVDHVLALLPFEPAVHASLGGPLCTYVGHPLIERLNELRPNADEEHVRWNEPPLLLVLPGSRHSEIVRLMADFGAALGLIGAHYGPIDVVLPAVPHLEEEIRRHAASWPLKPRIILGEAEKLAAFRRARAALAASGTVTLELALAGVPMSVAYRVSPPEMLLKYVITVPSIVLANLVLGENTVPEFLQRDCTPEKLAASILPLLRNGPERSAQVEAFARLDRLMRLDEGGTTPSEKVAQLVLGSRCSVGAGR
jgi:lipid-A-disaccharide synthase